MYCIGCNYDLSWLNAGPCPECGRAFDPRDDSTFFCTAHQRRLENWMKISIVVLGTLPLLTEILVHFTLVAARLSLGRWPHRWGRDDPTGIHWIVSSIYYLTGFTIVLRAVSFILLFGLLFGVLKPRTLTRYWRALLFALILWIAGTGISFGMGDPAQAWLWYMD